MKSPLLSAFTPYLPDSSDFQTRGLRSSLRFLKTGSTGSPDCTPPGKAEDSPMDLAYSSVRASVGPAILIETVGRHGQENAFSHPFRENNLPLMEFNSASRP